MDDNKIQCRQCGMPGEMTATMLRQAAVIAAEHQAQAILVCGGNIAEHELLAIDAEVLTIFLLAGDSGTSTSDQSRHIIRVPYLPPTRMSQIRMGILLALSRGLLEPDDTVVCVSGLSDSGVLDAVVAMRIGEEFAMFLGSNKAEWESSDVRSDVLQRVLEVATELGVEGREGHAVGALFVVGDLPNVLPLTHQMVLNPFQGYGPEQRNILDTSGLGETIKEFSTIDGAFLIQGDGAIVSVGTHIDSALVARERLPQGLGARHRAAAAITGVTNCIAIALSHSTGNVMIFRKGRIVAELPKPTAPRQKSTAPSARSDMGGRILIVGGGIAGLSIALRLAEAGLPVTLLEAGRLGSGATTRNQGRLWSGASIALDEPQLAKMFHASLQQTLALCPGCVEPQTESMLYFFTDPEIPVGDWTRAWRAAGISYEPVPISRVAYELPLVDPSRIREAFRLPDRSIRADILLNHLAVAARQAGVTIQTETPVVEFISDGEKIQSVVTAQGEKIPARFVIMATGSPEHSLLPTATLPTPGPNSGSRSNPAFAEQLAARKSHLVAVMPGIGRTPFCLVGPSGLTHLPHDDLSVFGSSFLSPATSMSDAAVVPEEIERLWQEIHRLLPELDCGTDLQTIEWAGATIHLCVGQDEPRCQELKPTILEHWPLRNTLTAISGRATLWPVLAERTRQAVLRKLNTTPIAAPPWANLASHRTP